MLLVALSLLIVQSVPARAATATTDQRWELLSEARTVTLATQIPIQRGVLPGGTTKFDPAPTLTFEVFGRHTQGGGASAWAVDLAYGSSVATVPFPTGSAFGLLRTSIPWPDTDKTLASITLRKVNDGVNLPGTFEIRRASLVIRQTGVIKKTITRISLATKQVGITDTVWQDVADPVSYTHVAGDLSPAPTVTLRTSGVEVTSNPILMSLHVRLVDEVGVPVGSSENIHTSFGSITSAPLTLTSGGRYHLQVNVTTIPESGELHSADLVIEQSTTDALGLAKVLGWYSGVTAATTMTTDGSFFDFGFTPPQISVPSSSASWYTAIKRLNCTGDPAKTVAAHLRNPSGDIAVATGQATTSSDSYAYVSTPDVALPAAGAGDTVIWDTKTALSTGCYARLAASALRVVMTLRSVPVVSDLTVSRATFSPDGDTIEDTTAISAALTVDDASATWTANITDSAGTNVRSHSESVSCPSGCVDLNVSWEWDGKDTAGQTLAEGTYSVSLSAADSIAASVPLAPVPTAITLGWKQRATASASQPVGFGSSMAYDPLQQRAVLFGGCSGPTTRTVNVLLTDGTAPPGDTPDARMRAMGGCHAAYTRGQTWIWSGQNYSWEAVVVPLGAPPQPHRRYLANMAYDYQSHRIILFGGLYDEDDSEPGADHPAADVADECIERDSEEAGTGSSPYPERLGIQSVTNVAGNPVHAYCFKDTWYWDWTDRIWRPVPLAMDEYGQPVPSPPARFDATMAVGTDGKPVLVGGCAGYGLVHGKGANNADPVQAAKHLYESWDCARYSNPSNPYYDPNNEYSEEWIDGFVDTWVFDSDRWVNRSCSSDPATCPTERRGASGSFIRRYENDYYSRDGMAFFGGYYYSPALDYVGYDGDLWKFVTSAGSGGWIPLMTQKKHDGETGCNGPVPMSRGWSAMALGAVAGRQVPIVYGGEGTSTDYQCLQDGNAFGTKYSLQDQWSWGPEVIRWNQCVATCTQTLVTAHPGPRESAPMIFDESIQSLVLAPGKCSWSGCSGSVPGGTWTYYAPVLFPTVPCVPALYCVLP